MEKDMRDATQIPNKSVDECI
ncbi:hypothetical protein EMIT0P218_140025 [Pseudomonas sp. IT-P218]